MSEVVTLLAERLRVMTADQKVRLSHALWIEARNVMSAGIRARHPDWSDEQVADCVRGLLRDAGP